MMQRKHIITAAAAVVLIAVGVFGGFKIHDTFFTPSGTYNGTVNQLQEPSKSDSISDARNTAVVQAANIINQHMAAFMNLAETPEVEEEASIFAPEVTNDNAELDKQIEDLDLSVRSYNCLKRASIHSVRQLVEFSENDLLNIRNFGVKSIEEVKDKLESMGLSLKA